MSIAERAMIVNLSIKAWTGRKTDKNATADVHRRAGAAADAGAYKKRLISPTRLHAIGTVVSQARAYHYEQTLPWHDGGGRILPSALFFGYSETMRAFEQSFTEAVAAFLADYAAAVTDSRTRLNGLFDPADYPALDDLRKRFSWDVGIEPMPTAADFRINLGADVEERIKADIEQRATDAAAKGTRQLWQRLYNAVETLAEKLAGDETSFKRYARESMVEHIRRLTAILPAMNLTDDPELEKARQTVEGKIACLNLAELRDNEPERSKAAADAKGILDAMAGFMGAPEQ